MLTQLRRFLLALSSCAILAGGLLAAAGASASTHRRPRAPSESPASTAPQAGSPQESAFPQQAGGPRESGGPGTAVNAGESPTPGESGASSPGRGGRRAHRLNGRRGGGCTLDVEASSILVTAGETVTLSGRLVCPEGTALAGETITVRQRSRGAGGPSASDLPPVTVGADGSYHMTTPALSAKSVFVLRSSLARRGARAAVRVAPQVTLAGPAADGARLATRGDRRGGGGRNRFTFTGTVNPAAAGTEVALQREYAASGEQWRTIALGRVDGEGHYSIAHSFRSPGEVSVRVIAHAKDEVPSASEPLTYDIVQAQNPALTIEGSPDPVVAGESATITGVAAGPANQSVTLLARTQQGGFSAVAKASTDAGGAYTFTVAPEHNTYYRVIDAGTSSTQLFEGVRYTLSLSPLPSTVQSGGALTFSGTLLPAAAGQVVYLQRQNPDHIGFHTVASTTVDGAQSFSVPYTFGAPGTVVMRIKVPATEEMLGSTSEPFTIAVTSPPAGAMQGQAPAAAG